MLRKVSTGMICDNSGKVRVRRGCFHSGEAEEVWAGNKMVRNE
jgi:hypothetical protein